MKPIYIYILTIALIVSAVLPVAATARTYNGGGAAGVAWNIGGIEILPEFGVFLCAGNLNPDGTFTPNPLAAYFPELISDC